MAWTCPEEVGRMRFSPGGLLLATTTQEAIENDSKDTLRMWDVLSGQEVAHLKTANQVIALAFAAERTLVFFEDKGCRLWDVDSGEVRKILNKTTNGGTTVLGGKAAAVSLRGEGDVAIVDLSTGKVRHKLSLPAQTEIWYEDLDAAGRYLAAICRADRDDYHLVVLWDVEQGKRLRTYDYPGWDYSSLALHPEGSLIAVAARTIYAFGLDWEEELEGFKPFKCDDLRDLRYSADGRALQVLNSDRLVRLDSLTGRKISSFKLPASFAWGRGVIDPAGEKVAVVGGQEIEVLDIRDG